MRYSALIPLALCCACTVAPRPPAQALAPAPTIPALATQPPADARGTLNAAQVQATEAAQQTQAASSATQQKAFEVQLTQTAVSIETRSEHESRLLELSVTQTALAIIRELDAYSASARLTRVYVVRVEADSTATQQAIASENVRKIDAANQARESAGAWVNFWMICGFVALGIVAYAAHTALCRWRFSPYRNPDGSVIVQQRPQPLQLQAPDPLTPESKLGLSFLRDCLRCAGSIPGFVESKVPTYDKLRQAGSRFGTGESWQNARNLFGALLESGPAGTFYRHGPLHSLYADVARGKIRLPYAIPAPPSPADEILENEAHSRLSEVFAGAGHSPGE